MTDRRNALTPEALLMVDAIARTGSFAAAARELGRVPSALTYQVHQLEEALDRPVVTSNQALAWDLARTAGVTGPAPGRGRLFRAA